MKKKRIDSTWPEVWGRVREVLEKNGASEDVLKASHPKNVGWNYGEGKFYILCPEVLYRWMEVPLSPDEESNLYLIKPILWPMMQKYNCIDLCYRIINC